MPMSYTYKTVGWGMDIYKERRLLDVLSLATLKLRKF